MCIIIVDKTARTSQRCVPVAGVFLCGDDFMDVKEPISFDEQLAKIEERGCFVSDKAFAKRKLQQINYYRLTAYFLPFKNADGTYKDETSFNNVFRIYEFDRKMRCLIFSTIEEIELMLRTQLAYYHATKYGALGYLNPENFNNMHNAEIFEKRLQEKVEHNKEQFFVKHHVEKYNSQFPLWVIIELFTFGDLSFFYSDMVRTDKKYLAKTLFNTSDRNVSSWLLCLTHLRNYCAHYSRLYFNSFGTVPATPKDFSYKLNDKLFDYILTVKFLYPDHERWTHLFLVDLENLIEEYSDVINMQHIGFPDNWKKLLSM